MGYQALLFCPDEKLARVVTQVFSDLDFTVEPVNEPFSAVKKLMALRYDALVVDCENEQNASLLFKSARNSSSNQSSLALALVEGQAGVAKAYRIGANLVLTKPINVEQAKGTLRVARGLLRKNLDAAPAPAAAKPAPTPTADSHPTTHHQSDPIPSAHNLYEAPEFLQEMVASAKVETPIVIPALDAQAKLVAELSAPVREVSAPRPEKPAITPVPSAPVKAAVSSHPGTTGTAAAPAPAKEHATPVEKRSMAPEFVGHAQVSSAPIAPTQFDAPMFAALGKEYDSDSSGGAKKILMVAAAVVVAAALGYFGWTKFGQKSTGTQPVSSPPIQAGTPSSTAPTTPPAANAPEPIQPSSSSTASQFSKPSAAANTPSAIKHEVEAEDEPVVKKPATPAIIVKSATPGKRASASAEESAPQVPNPFAVAPANDKHLSTLVASAPVNLPKAVPSTLRISQGVSQGLLIKRVQPRYPQNALSMRIQGVVQLEATIDKEGNVKNLKVVSGDAVLARAATDAVRQWRYKPYYLDGDPVEIQTQISVNFRLPN